MCVCVYHNRCLQDLTIQHISINTCICQSPRHYTPRTPKYKISPPFGNIKKEEGGAPKQEKQKPKVLEEGTTSEDRSSSRNDHGRETPRTE